MSPDNCAVSNIGLLNSCETEKQTLLIKTNAWNCPSFTYYNMT